MRSNPYPGLRPFRDDEEDLFFGRESQVDRMVDLLAAHRFLAVVGTSGSGKSSLVNCGLRPALHRGLLASAGSSWRVAHFRPGSRPTHALAQALAAPGILFPAADTPGMPLDQIVEATLHASSIGVADIFEQARLDASTNLLLVADQFEELFRYDRIQPAAGAPTDSSAEASAFVKLLLEARRHPRIHVVLTMRSDFLGDCAQYLGLPEAINEGQHLVPRMTRSETRAAIEGPAGVVGQDISPVLLTRVLNDVGDNPDQLSLLQHALNRTWSYWLHDDGGRGALDLVHYEAVGTISGALDRHAEKAYAELASDKARVVCERIFRALTDRGTDARGIRRPTPFGRLCAIADASPAEVLAVMDTFRKPSRSFLMPPLLDAVGPDTVIDISHESLMRVWSRLRSWSEDEAASARTYERLAESARLHAAGKASLWRDPDLQLTLDWRRGAEPNAAWAAQYEGDFACAMSFLDASLAEEARRKSEAELDRRWRAWRRGIAVATVVIFFVLALLFGEDVAKAIELQFPGLASSLRTIVTLAPFVAACSALFVVASSAGGRAHRRRVYPEIESSLIAAAGRAESAPLTPHRQRSARRRRVLLAAASVGVVIVLAGMTNSWLGNRELALKLEAAASAVAVAEGPFTKPPDVEALSRLDALRAMLDSLHGYVTDGPPLRLRWMVWRGDDAYHAANLAWMASYHAQLGAAATRTLVDSLRSLPDAPAPTSDYAQSYAALKAYLILTKYPERSSPAFLAPVLLNAWQASQTMPATGDITDLARRQFDYFARQLAFAPDTLHSTDESLVAHTRAFLDQFASIERIYAYVLSEAANATAPALLSDVVAKNHGEIRAAPEMPGAYTAQGWEFVQAKSRTLNAYSQGERWVVGESAGGGAHDPARTADDLRERYAAEYVERWRAYVRSISVAQVTSAADVAHLLSEIASPTSPLLGAFSFVARNTNVDSATAHAFQPVHAVTPPAMSTLVSPSNVAYVEALSSLRSALESAARISVRDTASAQAAARAASIGFDQVTNASTAARWLATRFTVNSTSADLAPAVANLLLAPIASARTVLQIIAETRPPGLPTAAAAGTGAKPLVVVLAFTDKSPNPVEDYDALGRGIQDLLITDLSAELSVRIVDRARDARYTDAYLTSGGVLECASAAEDEYARAAGFTVGKLLQPDYALTGSYWVTVPRLRIEARLLNLSTRRVEMTSTVEGPIEDLFGSTSRLTEKVRKDFQALSAKSFVPRCKQSTLRLPIRVAVLYGKALEAIDKKNTNQAIDLLKEVLAAFPDYEPAQRELEKLGVKLPKP